MSTDAAVDCEDACFPARRAAEDVEGISSINRVNDLRKCPELAVTLRVAGSHLNDVRMSLWSINGLLVVADDSISHVLVLPRKTRR